MKNLISNGFQSLNDDKKNKLTSIQSNINTILGIELLQKSEIMPENFVNNYKNKEITLKKEKEVSFTELKEELKTLLICGIMGEYTCHIAIIEFNILKKFEMKISVENSIENIFFMSEITYNENEIINYKQEIKELCFYFDLKFIEYAKSMPTK